MRYLLLFVLLAFSFGQLAAQDAAPAASSEFSDHPARVVGNINGLNVRSTPAIESDNIVGRLQPGQQVHVLAREGDWQQVRSEDGQFGWAHSDYLIDLPPRQLGETRLFRIFDPSENRHVLIHAVLITSAPTTISTSIHVKRNCQPKSRMDFGDWATYSIAMSIRKLSHSGAKGTCPVLKETPGSSSWS